MKPIRRISFTCKFHSSCTTNESGCKIFASPDLSRLWNAWFWRSNKKQNIEKDLPLTSWGLNSLLAFLSSSHIIYPPWGVPTGVFFFHQWHNDFFHPFFELQPNFRSLQKTTKTIFVLNAILKICTSRRKLVYTHWLKRKWRLSFGLQTGF